MKKLLSLLLLLILPVISISLSSCKVNDKKPVTSKTDPSGGEVTVTEESTTLSSQRAENVARQIENGRFDNFKNYSDEDKALIKESVEKDGYTLEYNGDGTATLSNEEGSWFIGTGWTDNEYTKGLPAPDFGTVTMAAEDEEKGKAFYMFLIKNATAQQAADYVKKLEDAGFEPTQEKVVDVENSVIMFYGRNSGGKSIELGYTSKGLTVKIYK